MSSSSSEPEQRSSFIKPFEPFDRDYDAVDLRELVDRSSVELQDFKELQRPLESLRQVVYDLADRLERGEVKEQESSHFSSVSRQALEEIGVRVHAVDLKAGALSELGPHRHLTSGDTVIHELAEDIRFMSEHVEAGASDPVTRMFVDAVLGSLGEIIRQRSNHRQELDVYTNLWSSWVVQPVCVEHPTTKQQLWLHGEVDYAMFRYNTEDELVQNCLTKPTPRVLADLKEGIFEEGKLLGPLVSLRAKAEFAREPGPVDINTDHTVTECICQMLRLLETTAGKSPPFTRIRFCITNGLTWMPCFLTKENGQFDCYFVTGTTGRGLDILMDSSADELQKSVCDVVSVLFSMMDPETQLDDFFAFS